MLLLLIQIGDSRYAIDSSELVEVVPSANLNAIPQAPAYVAGLLNYRGASVPVIDMCQLGTGRACTPCMTTRIVLVNYQPTPDFSRVLGLLAESVMETRKANPKDFQRSGICVSDAPYLGDVSTQEDGMIQLVRVTQLLPDAVREMLYSADAA